MKDTLIFLTTVDLPETSNWAGTIWQMELDSAIADNYTHIMTPDLSLYEIIDNSRVKNVPNIINKKEEDKLRQYTCPNCGVVGAHPTKMKFPLCHKCNDKVTMLPSQNGKILSIWDVYPFPFSNFVDKMGIELNNNTYKGNFWKWEPTAPELILNIDYHLIKLKKVILSGDRSKIKEYLADIGNLCAKVHQIFGEEKPLPVGDNFVKPKEITAWDSKTLIHSKPSALEAMDFKRLFNSVTNLDPYLAHTNSEKSNND